MIAITPQTVVALAPLVDGKPWVAFVEARNRAGSLVKVEATRNLVARVRAIDNDNPLEVSLLGLMTTAEPAGLVRVIQTEHQNDRAKGDWFNASATFLTFVEKAAQPALVQLVQQLRLHVAPAPVLTVSELAQLLQVSEQTIYRRVREGLIPFMKVGNQYRFVAADVLATARQG